MFDLKIGVIGCGYWGKNLIRNFYELNVLKYVCDKRKRMLKISQKIWSIIPKSLNEIFEISDLDGIVIATPAENHFDLAKKGLEMINTFLWKNHYHLKLMKRKSYINYLLKKKKFLWLVICFNIIQHF